MKGVFSLTLSNLIKIQKHILCLAILLICFEQVPLKFQIPGWGGNYHLLFIVVGMIVWLVEFLKHSIVLSKQIKLFLVPFFYIFVKVIRKWHILLRDSKVICLLIVFAGLFVALLSNIAYGSCLFITMGLLLCVVDGAKDDKV